MDNEEMQKLKRIILNQSTDNSGDLLHKYIMKNTEQLKNLDTFSEIMNIMFEGSLFVGCRELLRLKNLVETSQVSGENQAKIKNIFRQLEKDFIRDKIDEYFKQNDFGLWCEVILALYTIGDEKQCKKYLANSEVPSRFMYKIVEICAHNKPLVKHVYDFVLFFLNASKELDEIANSKCIRAIRFQKKDANDFWEAKKEEICQLAKFYYERDQYISLASLIRVFEIHSDKKLQYKSKIYEYVGTKKEDFLKQAYDNGTAKALGFYFVVKYPEEFPTLNDIREILDLKTYSSVYCVVNRCFKHIKRNQSIDDNVREILQFIKEQIQNGELYFDYEQMLSDKGIDNNLLRINIVKSFQELCEKEQDVKEFLELVDYFNPFRNEELRLDYNILKDKDVKSANWKSEYEYICKKYKDTPADVVYIVMNTYLRFFVDVEEFYNSYKEELKPWWFPGYVKKRIKLFQARDGYNKDFAKKKYVIQEVNETSRKTPEELRYVRFKIESISSDNNKIIIEVKELQSIAEECKEVVSKNISEMLRAGKIPEAFYYLKSCEKIGYIYNLFEINRYTHIKENTIFNGEVKDTRVEGADEIEELFSNCSEDNKWYLQYLYLNSFIKNSVSFSAFMKVFDREQYILGDVKLTDNWGFRKSDCYKIRPNYYPFGPYYKVTPPEKLFFIKKEKLPKELKYFIDDQLTTIAQMEKEEKLNRENGQRSNKKQWKSVRVCFYIKKESYEIDKINLHCCEREIVDMPSMLQTFYEKISKTNREGIAYSVAVKYMEAYSKCSKTGKYMELNDGWKSFLKLYLYYLMCDISKLHLNYCKNIEYWMYRGDDYRKTNHFVTVQSSVFDELKINENEEIKKFIKEDQNYRKILDGIRHCLQYDHTYDENARELSELEKDIVKIMYDTTIMRFLFDSKDAFEEAIYSS